MRWLTFAASVIGLLAQSPPAREEFDVVSVKPSAPDDHNSFMFQNLEGGTVRMVGVPLRMLIMQSFGVKAFQISGGPDWIRTERWDILGKAEGVQGRLPRAEENPMLQALMRDRFQLKVHTDTKEMPVYALTVAKNGAKLALHTGTERRFRPGNGSLNVKKGGMKELAEWLSRELGRVVIDKTELLEEYDYSLEWTPEVGEGGPESIGMAPEAAGPRVEANGPTIFTALQEGLVEIM